MSSHKRAHAHAAITALVATFPAAFASYGEGRRPLKQRIDCDLAARGVDPAVIRYGLRFYCRSHGYLSAMKAGAPRIDLDGNVAGTVSPEAAVHAREQLAELLAPAAAKPEPYAAKPEPKARVRGREAMASAGAPALAAGRLSRTR